MCQCIKLRKKELAQKIKELEQVLHDVSISGKKFAEAGISSEFQSLEDIRNEINRLNAQLADLFLRG